MNISNGIHTATRTIDVENIHSNVTPEILEITTDKLKIVLLEHDSALSGSADWHTPLGIFLTIVLVLCTADFRIFLGIPSDTWSAIFIMSAGLSLVWLIKSFVTRTRRMTIDELMECMKKQV